MSEEMKKDEADMKSRVMGAINSKKIKMRSHFVFVAEKLGLESAMALAIILGAILISLLLYFIKKTGLLKFLTFGYPGMKIFLATLPYDYIILFILMVAGAIYFANRLELFCGKCERTNFFTVWFFFGALILGLFFGALGLGGILGGWSHNHIPHDRAIRGQIKSFEGNEVSVMEEDGNMVHVFLPDSGEILPLDGDADEKFLRAIGRRDKEDPSIFHAINVRCCDSD